MSAYRQPPPIPRDACCTPETPHVLEVGDPLPRNDGLHYIEQRLDSRLPELPLMSWWQAVLGLVIGA